MRALNALGVLLLLLAACSEEVINPVPIDSVKEACEGFELEGELAIDQRTGLRWDRRVEQAFRNHEEAAAVCTARGARLPTRAELLALRVESEDDACKLPACPFKGPRCLTIQCGSEIPGTNAHWGVAMSGGALISVAAGQAEALLCVRDPLPQ